MNTTVVGVYDNFQSADAARVTLLNEGFTASAVELTCRDDEAGPVEGNFILDCNDAGDKRLAHAAWANRKNPLVAPRQRNDFTLCVETGDPTQWERAMAIVEISGGVSIDSRTGNHG